MPSEQENRFLINYLATAGRALGGEGSVGDVLGAATQQQIAAEGKHKLSLQYMKMMREWLAGGAKVSGDKDTLNIKVPTSTFNPFEESTGIPGSAPAAYTKTQRDTPINPSASPLDVSSADLVGLTPQDVSQALAGALGVEEISRKRISDITQAQYYRAATEKAKAETKAITPSIDIGGGIVLTNKQFIDVWKAANKDERTAARKNYEYAVSQGYEGKFEDWVISLAEASGKSTAQILAEFIAKKEAGTGLELAGPDFPSDVKADLMKDRSTWGYPSTYNSWISKGHDETTALDLAQKTAVLNEMDSRIKSFYKGKTVERKKDGWYIDGVLQVRNPYGR